MPCTPAQVTSHLLTNHSENYLRKTRLFTQLSLLALSVFAGTSAQAESCPTDMTEWGTAYGAQGFDGVQYGEHGGDSEAAKVVDNDQAGESACLKSGSKLESGRGGVGRYADESLGGINGASGGDGGDAGDSLQINASDFTLQNNGELVGGVGGIGGHGGFLFLTPFFGGHGGEGGNGGNGLVATQENFTLWNHGDILGGDGHHGGYGSLGSFAGLGGIGGDGGAGVISHEANTQIINDSGRHISGGHGGDGNHSGNGFGGHGGDGGAGGQGIVINGTHAEMGNAGDITGGTGGDGGYGFFGEFYDVLNVPGHGGGHGGQGGAGIVINEVAATLANDGSIIGGDGGNGDVGGEGSESGLNTKTGDIIDAEEGGSGGDGGDGAHGIVIREQHALLHNHNEIIGGDGGKGNTGGKGGIANEGDHRAGDGAVGGDGGLGGTGVSSQATNSTLINEGTIIGGNGGQAGDGGAPGDGNGGSAGDSGSNGEGAPGVGSTGGLNVVNAGLIEGGQSVNGTRANALELDGGNNQLTLDDSYEFVGNVVSKSGTENGGDQLTLGGSTDNTFDVSTITSAEPTNWTGSTQYSGFNRYAKTGTSTWTLTGSTSEKTPWHINEGVLSISSDAALGSSAAALNVNGGSLEITGTDLTTLNRSIHWGSAGGGIDISDADNTVTVSKAFTGSGGFYKLGEGTLALTGDSSDLSGHSAVLAGTLAVNGQLGGALTVEDGGSVAGNGLIGGNLDVKDGGAISPGNSIGTITIAGDYHTQSGSTYDAEVDVAGNHDVIEVEGRAILNGGSVAINAEDGDYDPLQSYTILRAKKGVYGEYDEVTSNLAYIYPKLLYGQNAVDLRMIRNDVKFSFPGHTHNQQHTLDAISDLAFGNPLYDAVLISDAPGARRAADALSGEAHASRQSTLLLDARYIRDAVSQRLNDDCHGSNEVAEQASENPTNCSGKLWMQAYGNWSHLDGSQGTARIDHDISGFFLGGDKTFTNRLTLGLIAGYGHSTSDVHERDSRDKADHFHLGGYLGYRQGAFALKAGLSHSEHRSDSRRYVSFGDFHDTLTARPHARTTQVFTEMTYDVDMSGFTLTPFVRGAYAHLDAPGFTEHGHDAALKVRDSHHNEVSTLAGVRFVKQLTTKRGNQIDAHATLGWNHIYRDRRPMTQVAFREGDSFTVYGTQLPRDSAHINVGIAADFKKNMRLGVAYVGDYGSGLKSSGADVNLSWEF